MRIGFNIFS